MCVASMIGDHYRDKWTQPKDIMWPGTIPGPSIPSWPPLAPGTAPYVPNPYGIVVHTVTREEFEALRKEVLEMKALLIRAKVYDEANNQPNCEMEDKIAILKRVAEMVGVSLEEVFGSAGKP